jgi:spermidine synthase
VAFFQIDEVTTTHQRMRQSFTDQSFYCAAVPTYYGGVMTFAWGSQDRSLREIDQATLQQRFDQSGINTRYYTPAIHRASFALPRYIQDALTDA